MNRPQSGRRPTGTLLHSNRGHSPAGLLPLHAEAEKGEGKRPAYSTRKEIETPVPNSCALGASLGMGISSCAEAGRIRTVREPAKESFTLCPEVGHPHVKHGGDGGVFPSRPRRGGHAASRHGRPSFIPHTAAAGSSTQKRGERFTSHGAGRALLEGRRHQASSSRIFGAFFPYVEAATGCPFAAGTFSSCRLLFSASSVLLSSLCEPLQNAGGNDPSLAFCRQAALFFSSYHPEKEHSLSLARPMLNGSVPRPLPGGGPFPCAARAVRPGISNPTSGRLQGAPGGWRKALPAFGQGGPRDRMPGYPNRAARPALRDGPPPCQKARPAPSGQGRHSCAARAGSRREHRSSSVWRRLCLLE